MGKRVICLILVALFAVLPAAPALADRLGTIIGSGVTPGTSTLTFASAWEDEISGGYKVVADATGRNAITPERRVVGMPCYVISENKTYRLVGGILDANWVADSADGMLTTLGLTTNSIPSLSSGYTLGDSGMYAVSGRIGIGTSAPISKLQVDGAIYAGLTIPHHSQVSSGLSGNAMFGRNVEIDGALYVDSSIYMTGSIYGDGSKLTNLSAGSMITQNDTTVAIADGTAMPIKFSVDGSTRMVLDTNGNVGIGTTAPVFKAEIQGDTAINGANLYVRSSPSVVWDFMKLSTDASVGRLLAKQVDFRIGVNNAGDATETYTDVFSITQPSGNVGIGTTAPRTRMEISGGMTVTGDVTVAGNVSIGAPNALAKLYVSGGNVIFSADGTYTGAYVKPLYIAQAGAVEMRLHSTDNNDAVGILFQGSGSRGSIYSDGSYKFKINSNNAYSTGAVYINDTDSGIVSLAKGGGNVGIGVITPANTLDVKGNMAVGVAYAGTSTAPLNGLIVQGRVGMGIAAPLSALQVDGGIYVGTTKPSNAGVDLSQSGSGMFGKNVEIDGLLYVDGTIYGDGSHLTGVTPAIQSKSFTVESPADTDNILLFKAVTNMTVSHINCIVDPADSGESAVIDVQQRDSAGDNPVSMDTTITCGNGGATDDGSLSNASVAAGKWVSLDIGVVVGTVSQLSVTITY